MRSSHHTFGLLRRSLILTAAVLLMSAGLASAAGTRRAATATATSALRDAPAPKEPAKSAAAFPIATPSRVLRATDPLGNVANVNTAVPPFQIAFAYSLVRPGTLRLKTILMKPVSRDESVKGGCSSCTGSGHFLPYTIHGHLFQDHTSGTVLMTKHTRIVEAVIRPGETGRFKLYGISLGPPTHPVSLLQGCIAADALPVAGATSPILLDALLHPNVLPQVPCSGTPRGDSVTFFRPPSELSATAAPTGGFTGHTGGPRWLSVFQANQTCAPDPLAEARRTQSHIFWHVNGNFSKGFRGVPATKPGFFCAYLQSGGKFAGIPDGRMGLTWSAPYYAGDVLSITGQGTVSPGQSVADTFEGVASVPEELWSFDSFTPCAGTAQGEFPTAAGVSHTTVHGSFSLTVTAIPLSHSFFRCAYLNVGAPKNGQPTGPSLVRASLAITVQ